MILKSNEDFTLKFILLGDTNAGKTSILSRFTEENNDISPSHIATIGMDQRIKYVNFKDYKIRLDLWDSAGQERFQSITANYLRGVDGILFVFDLTNIESLTNLKSWFKLIEKNCESAFIKAIILANKSDLEDQIQVSPNDIKKVANKHNMKYIETSALLNNNIKEAFMLLIDEILSDDNFDELLENKRLRNKTTSLYIKQSSCKKCC